MCVSLDNVKARRGRLTRCPLAFGNIGPPSLPVSGAFAVLLEALFLFAEVFLILNENHGDYVSRCGVGGVLQAMNE